MLEQNSMKAALGHFCVSLIFKCCSTTHLVVVFEGITMNIPAVLKKMHCLVILSIFP